MKGKKNASKMRLDFFWMPVQYGNLWCSSGHCFSGVLAWSPPCAFHGLGGSTVSPPSTFSARFLFPLSLFLSSSLPLFLSSSLLLSLSSHSISHFHISSRCHRLSCFSSFFCSFFKAAAVAKAEAAARVSRLFFLNIFFFFKGRRRKEDFFFLLW